MEEQRMILGFLGVGHLATSVVEGLLRSGLSASQLLPSPRARGRHSPSARSRGRCDNADLVRRSDIVFLAVRPADVALAVGDLPWRAGQLVISACAGVPSPNSG